jgi:glucose 1-dehydrogenase
MLAKVKAIGDKRYLAECPHAHAHTIQVDLGNVDMVRELIAESIGHFGKLDILVNKAGIEKHAPFWDVVEADYDAVLNVNESRKLASFHY